MSSDGHTSKKKRISRTRKPLIPPGQLDLAKLTGPEHLPEAIRNERLYAKPLTRRQQLPRFDGKAYYKDDPDEPLPPRR